MPQGFTSFGLLVADLGKSVPFLDLSFLIFEMRGSAVLSQKSLLAFTVLSDSQI